jgi:hypothetical protein
MYLLAPDDSGGDAAARFTIVPTPTGGAAMWESRF